jgi:D-amino peptidase
VDIEGAVGIAHWDEADSSHSDYGEFQDRMTQEAVAACAGALAAGATEIWVKDAHGSGRNIRQEALPREAKLVRGWSGHPYGMVQELDSSFDACCFVGYHGHAGHPANPLSHTNTGMWNRITLNGEDLSEYLQHAYCAALEGVPVVFVSGDTGVCEITKAANPVAKTVATNQGFGESVVALMHPETGRDLIRAGVQAALESDLSEHALPTVRAFAPIFLSLFYHRLRGSRLHGIFDLQASHYTLKVRWTHHGKAFKYSFYPGATLEDSQTTGECVHAQFTVSCAFWICFDRLLGRVHSVRERFVLGCHHLPHVYRGRLTRGQN